MLISWQSWEIFPKSRFFLLLNRCWLNQSSTLLSHATQSCCITFFFYFSRLNFVTAPQVVSQIPKLAMGATRWGGGDKLVCLCRRARGLGMSHSLLFLLSPFLFCLSHSWGVSVIRTTKKSVPSQILATIWFGTSCVRESQKRSLYFFFLLFFFFLLSSPQQRDILSFGQEL